MIAGVFPGFGGLLKHGRWVHLAIALAFALILNTVLFINFYWTDFLTPSGTRLSAFALGTVWLVLSGISSLYTRRFDATKRLDSRGELYLEVLNHYLKGNWEKTECCAKALLRYNPNDVEVLLLLATLYRHTRRLDLAGETLARLELLEAADHWVFEIYHEKKCIAQLMSPSVPIGEPEMDDGGEEAEPSPAIPFYTTQVG